MHANADTQNVIKHVKKCMHKLFPGSQLPPSLPLPLACRGARQDMPRPPGPRCQAPTPGQGPKSSPESCCCRHRWGPQHQEVEDLSYIISRIRFAIVLTSR
eukprot:scaffold150993_cov15-Tisochrysis_lutea.AAC.1